MIVTWYRIVPRTATRRKKENSHESRSPMAISSSSFSCSFFFFCPFFFCRQISSYTQARQIRVANFTLFLILTISSNPIQYSDEFWKHPFKFGLNDNNTYQVLKWDKTYVDLGCAVFHEKYFSKNKIKWVNCFIYLFLSNIQNLLIWKIVFAKWHFKKKKTLSNSSSLYLIRWEWPCNG